MFEIEAKVRLTPAQAKDIRKKVIEMATFKKRTIKEDRYYGSAKAANVRLRTEDGKSLLQYKGRERKQGIESNQELEFPIENVVRWDRLLRDNGFPLVGRKHKMSEAFQADGFSIELNEVRGLGHFLEIERVVRTKPEIQRAKKGLLAQFKSLGFAPKDFESKLYLELLSEKAKDKKANI